MQLDSLGETHGQKPYAVALIVFYETSRVGRSIEIEAKLGWLPRAGAEGGEV